MNTKFYNLGAIQENLKKYIAINTAYLDAWRKVSFPTKKDGKPFASLGKNIDGAKLERASYATQPYKNKLTICTFCNEAGYISDSLQCYELVRYLKDDAMIAKTENYMPIQGFLEQVYAFDLEDIKKEVAKRIAFLEGYIADLEKQLAKSKVVFDAFRGAYDLAVKTLQAETNEFAHKELYYAVLDTIKNRYPYC